MMAYDSIAYYGIAYNDKSYDSIPLCTVTFKSKALYILFIGSKSKPLYCRLSVLLVVKIYVFCHLRSCELFHLHRCTLQPVAVCQPDCFNKEYYLLTENGSHNAKIMSNVSKSAGGCWDLR